MLTCVMYASVCQGPPRYSEGACGQVRWPIKPISISTDTQGCGAAAGVARAPCTTGGGNKVFSPALRFSLLELGFQARPLKI
jgi:hypothetical protein